MQDQFGETQKDKPKEDSVLTATKLLTMGITPKGKTGCSSCDARGFIHCKCPPKKEGIKGGEKVDPKSDEDYLKRKDIDLDLDKTSAEAAKSKALKYSAPFSRLIPEFKVTLENPDKTKLSEKEAVVLVKIFNAIISEFDAFKKDLEHQGVSNKILKSYTAAKTNNGTALTIDIPNAKHHDAFIARLYEKKLLPEPKPPLRANEQPEKQDITSLRAPSPFKLAPSPFSTK